MKNMGLYDCEGWATWSVILVNSIWVVMAGPNIPIITRRTWKKAGQLKCNSSRFLRCYQSRNAPPTGLWENGFEHEVMDLVGQCNWGVWTLCLRTRVFQVFLVLIVALEIARRWKFFTWSCWTQGVSMGCLSQSQADLPMWRSFPNLRCDRPSRILNDALLLK